MFGPCKRDASISSAANTTQAPIPRVPALPAGTSVAVLIDVGVVLRSEKTQNVIKKIMKITIFHEKYKTLQIFEKI